MGAMPQTFVADAVLIALIRNEMFCNITRRVCLKSNEVDPSSGVLITIIFVLISDTSHL